jgi:hypothetical protein
MRDDPEQRRRSRYVMLLRLPVLPEFLMRQGGFKALIKALRQSKRPAAWSRDDLARYRAAWSQPGALTGKTNWYRALLRKPMPEPPRRITVPTRIVWGTDDKYAVTDLAERSLRLCDAGERLRISTRPTGCSTTSRFGSPNSSSSSWRSRPVEMASAGAENGQSQRARIGTHGLVCCEDGSPQIRVSRMGQPVRPPKESLLMPSRRAGLLARRAIRSPGRHALKGFDEPVELFTRQPMRPHILPP